MRKTNDEVILRMLQEGKKQKEIAEHFGVSPVAICKRVKRLLPPPKSLDSLTDKEKKFVSEVARGRTKTEAALKSFDVNSRESAKTIGIELMKKPQVEMAVKDLMEYYGMGRAYRVQKLKGHVDNRDPNISLKALDQSWKLDGGYVEHHIHHVVDWAELVRREEELDKEFAKHGLRVVEIDGELVETQIEETADSESNGEGVVDVEPETN